MKPKGRTAWLITWEGTKSEHDGRCKVVAILPTKYGDESIILSLRVLFHSESVLTLCEKMVPIASIHKDPFFKIAYRDVNPEYCYGYLGQHHLTARKVDNLRCEESKKDCLENTLYWTELPKFIPNPKYGPEGPPLEKFHDALREVVGEREEQYTYSIRPSIEAEKARRAKHNAP